ncbi:flagellar hook-associated protein FlgK, partial [Escherichia coli]|nr:flagellar hook-associated protein FlgK [Escherichia coli]
QGDTGKELFSFGKPAVTSNAKNTGTATVTATFDDTTKVQATDYQLEKTASGWTVTRLADKTSFAVTPDANGDMKFDGLTVNVSNNADANVKDSFILKPVQDVIVNMNMLVKDESKLAMASATGGGKSDNRNGQAMLDLQNSKLVGGNKSFNDAYASLVSTVGSSTASLKTSSQTKANVVTQLSNQQ